MNYVEQVKNIIFQLEDLYGFHRNQIADALSYVDLKNFNVIKAIETEYEKCNKIIDEFLNLDRYVKLNEIISFHSLLDSHNEFSFIIEDKLNDLR